MGLGKTWQASVVNGLSLGRLLMSPVFLFLATDPKEALLRSSIYLFALMLVSDWADGYLARRWRTESVFGYVLDGIADRAMYTSCFLVAMRYHQVTPLLVQIVIVNFVLTYGVRAIIPDWSTRIPSTRLLSKGNAVLIRAVIVVILLNVYWPFVTHTRESPLTEFHTNLLTGGYAFLAYVVLAHHARHYMLGGKEMVGVGGKEGKERKQPL